MLGDGLGSAEVIQRHIHITWYLGHRNLGQIEQSTVFFWVAKEPFIEIIKLKINLASPPPACFLRSKRVFVSLENSREGQEI
jgi:hypothetical protein